MAPKKSFPWWLIVLIVGCICIMCLCVVGVAGMVGSFGKNGISIPNLSPNGGNPIESYFISIFESVLSDYLGSPSSTGEPYNNDLPTGQQVSGDYFFDDFSTEAEGWLIFDNGSTILKYEGGQYSLQVTEPGYVDWTYAPIDFYASRINFNLQGLPGPQNGTFGVFCQYLDPDNYYYLEFDLELQEYLAGEILNGTETLFTDLDNDNYGWDSTQALKSSPELVNHISISCTLDHLSLSINGQFIQDFTISEPFDTSGDIAFFVYSFDFPDTEGYKVFIDDVEILNPTP